MGLRASMAGTLFGTGVAWALLWSSAAGAVDDGEVVIGVLTDVGGAYSGAAGQGSLLAAELAAEDFGWNIAGTDIRVEVADHENDPDVSRQEAERLHQSMDADLIVGMPSSAAALGAQAYAAGREDLVIIHTGSGTTRLTGQDCAANSLHWQYNTRALTTGITEALADRDRSLNWYVLALDHPFGHGVHEGIEQALAGTPDRIVGSHFHAFGKRDFYPRLEEAISLDADVIAIGNAGAGLIAAIRQAKELGVGVHDVQMVGVLTLLTDVRRLGLYAASGLRFVSPYYWDQSEASRAFAERFRRRLGKAPGSNHIAVYTATLHYLKAVAETGMHAGPRVMRAMKSAPVEDGITRNGRVRVDGRMIHDLNFVEVKKAGEVKQAQAYYRILKVLPAEAAFGPLNPECPLVEQTAG
ncbi:ABC transporter substrate-binding protein [Ectothiorhodospiraceae bacterium WFHF3C12]|nr:ABC transporter substrate-binding protein [Ectothiorhodospiraceae bacterium WFHF3C12]